MRSFIYRTMRQYRLVFWAPCALLILGLYQCGGSDPASPAGNGEPEVVVPDPTQRTALIALYEATDGANWRNNTNWQGQLHYNCPCANRLARYLLSHPALSRLVWMPALVVLSCWSKLSAMCRKMAIFSGPCPRRMRQ